jgi:hypothetical protein
MAPKAFISYSWTSPAHQALIREWAERLVSDGVDVVFDVYDLKEGDDKYAFMERMVSDARVTHVLVFGDKEYATKADSRKAGVGTESQIISKEVYDKVEQSKFIPIVCQFDDKSNPYLPVFLKSRIWIDFSSPEAVNENWERLVRLLFGKPANEKPKLGKPPAYILMDATTPASPAIAKFTSLRQAVLQGKKGTASYRRDFLDACIEYADALRVRERPTVEPLGKKVIEDCGKLKAVRNHIIDWVFLEAESCDKNEFSEVLVEFSERLIGLKLRPAELNTWSDAWFEAHAVFVYETFLYIIAALLKTKSFEVLHEVFAAHYVVIRSNRSEGMRFRRFEAFYGASGTLQEVLAPPGRRLFSPAANLIKQQADRQDIPFGAIMEAELLVLMMAFVTPDVWWYPQTLFYAEYMEGALPLAG